jgi:hypothetical protein
MSAQSKWRVERKRSWSTSSSAPSALAHTAARSAVGSLQFSVFSFQTEGTEDKSSFARSGYGVTGIKHQEEHGGESGKDRKIPEVGIPICPLTGRRSRSKQGTVFSVQAENISRMFGDGAREHIAMATSKASVSAMALARRMTLEFDT